MNGHYILSASGEPIPEPDIMKWALWFNNADARRVAHTELPDGTEVSTVFLGLDHSYGHGPPILFETMIFGGPLDETQDRYATRQAAINGHAHYVALAEKEATP